MRRRTVGFLLGLAVFLLCLLLPPPSSFHEAATSFLERQHASISPDALAHSMWTVLATALLMIIWWVTEAIPLAATALVPAAFGPLLHITGVHDGGVYEFTLRNILINYANPVIFLFLGGFLLAAAMQKWRLDRRLTLWILTRGKLADDSRKVLLAIMAATAFLSMWISNTATTALMLPLGLGILAYAGARPSESRFGTAMMLGIAYSASVGGTATIIGSPTNAVALGILNTAMQGDPTYARLTFAQWMMFGVPLVVIFVPIIWLVLLRIFPPEVERLSGGRERLLADLKELGPLTGPEKRTIGVLVLAAFLWIFLPLLQELLPESAARQISWLDEYSVGIMAGVLLFVIPADLKKTKFLLEWEDTRFVEWGVLLLFGGGIALSDAMFKTGLASWIAYSFVGLFGTPSTLVLMFAVILLVDFMTEVTSNTAVTSMVVPIVIAVGHNTGADPVLLSIAAAIAASLAFMLPVATPPNALVYGSGYISLKDMIRTGFGLDILGWIVAGGTLIVFGWLIFGLLQF